MGIRIKNAEEQSLFDSIYPELADNEIVKESCGDCLEGYIPAFGHVMGGICFRCNGRGFLESFTVQEYREREIRRYRDRLYNEKVKAKKLAKVRDEQQLKKNAWAGENKDIVEGLPTLTGSRKEIADDIMGRFSEPTPKQTELLRSLIQQEIEAAAKADEPKAQIPEGATEITGEIVSWKMVFDPYSGNDIPKITVKSDEGWRTYGTLPKALDENIYDEWLESLDDDASVYDFGPEYYLKNIKGRRVHFTATITPSDDDEEFGFYSRPRKVQLTK